MTNKKISVVLFLLSFFVIVIVLLFVGKGCNIIKDDKIIKKISTESFGYEVREGKDIKGDTVRFFDKNTGSLKLNKESDLKEIIDKVSGLTENCKPPFDVNYGSWKKIESFDPMIVQLNCDRSNKEEYKFSRIFFYFDQNGKILRRKEFSNETFNSFKILNLENGNLLFSFNQENKRYLGKFDFKSGKENFFEIENIKKERLYLSKGTLLKNSNKFIFYVDRGSAENKAGVYLYDFETEKVERLFSDDKGLMYYNEIGDMKISEDEKYLYLGISRVTRGPSKWIGFFVYDLNNRNFVYKERFLEQMIGSHWGRDLEITILPKNEIGFNFTDMTEQKKYFIKYKLLK